MRYNYGKNQYTEKEMQKRIRKLRWQLFRHKGFDILLTHAPAYELNDGADLPHRGYMVFHKLLEKYKPRFFVHGHVHMGYGRQHKRYTRYNTTHVINAYERCVFDFDDEEIEKHVR